MWWVLSSNSDHYGSSIRKTYGAVIRFYAEAPECLPAKSTDGLKSNTKLWCPLGICLTSSLPIVGILEAILLRVCEKLSLAAAGNSIDRVKSAIHNNVMNLILNYQRPIAGVVNCSIPFLSGDGDRLHVSLPPEVGLPPLPHGASVTSVCRLLGAEGLTALLAAVLTECKILMHSADVANLAMVGEVITALMYPFQWQLPFIPVLPLSMITFVEAPVSYFIGVPTCNMKFIQKHMLTDVFVIDLDNGLSSVDYFDGRLGLDNSRAPSPLPASVSSNISKAIFRLLREEEEIQDHFGLCTFSDNHHLTRLESESLAERDFRITIAHQLCGLIRGYQESLFYVSSCKPVFNRDRFLREAPALFDERRPSVLGRSSAGTATFDSTFNRIISPRSKRFLSGLVNTQHFHFLLETLESDSNAFFHKIMDTFEGEGTECSTSLSFGSSKHKRVMFILKSYLETSEQKISTYHVHNRSLEHEEEIESVSHYDGSYFTSFTSGILLPANCHTSAHDELPINSEIAAFQSKSCDLNESLTRPWVYRELFNIDMSPISGDSALWKKIHLREALGERKFNIWKTEQDAKAQKEDLEEDTVCDTISTNHSLNTLLDLTKLISHVKNDELSNQILPNKLKQGSVFHINVLRRYIEATYQKIDFMKSGTNDDSKASDGLDDIETGVSIAMKDASAQRFFISILSQRSRLQNEYRHTDHSEFPKFGNYIEGSTSNVHPLVFECLHHLCISMLDACQTDANFEHAYRLLVHTAGFRTIDNNMVACDLTSLIAKHQIYSDLSLWDQVFLIHQQDRLKDRKGTESKTVSSISKENDDYEATVSTLYEMLGYGMPADHLARFAYRIARDKFYFTDKEQKLLTLARRLAIKCDESSTNHDMLKCDYDDSTKPSIQQSTSYWEEIEWTHPGFGVNGFTTNFPITQLSSVGSSLVATGALDGSLFLASTMHLEKEKRGKIGRRFVRGEQLVWAENFHQSNPNTGTDGTVIPGSINCIGFTGLSQICAEKGMSFFENCHLVAGTANGYLGAWSVPNTLESVLFSDLTCDVGDKVPNHEIWLHAGGHQSSHVRSNSSPSAYNKRKHKAKVGRILGVHRSGVTCLSIPPQIYRPDSLISGGNDGVIKIWSLREQSDTSRNKVRAGARNSRSFFNANTKSQENEAVDMLNGHGGRILCLETAWHGDRLLSGATDHTMKVWDLSNQSGGRCLQTMRGHTGWLTHCKYWGRNTIVSASTDRSIALWDTRSGSRPLFVLRYHNAPVSDLYLESRTSSLLVSAASDGSIGTWDIRMMDAMGNLTETKSSTARSYIVRSPISQMNHSGHNAGPTLLGKGVNMKPSRGEHSFISVNTDNIIKEWDTFSGNLLHEHTLRCGKMSCFKSFTAEENLTYKVRNSYGTDTQLKLGGTITGTWDGAVKLQWLCINRCQ
jgi:WD40 repeat protein